MLPVGYIFIYIYIYIYIYSYASYTFTYIGCICERSPPQKKIAAHNCLGRQIELTTNDTPFIIALTGGPNTTNRIRYIIALARLTNFRRTLHAHTFTTRTTLLLLEPRWPVCRQPGLGSYVLGNYFSKKSRHFHRSRCIDLCVILFGRSSTDRGASIGFLVSALSRFPSIEEHRLVDV